MAPPAIASAALFGSIGRDGLKVVGGLLLAVLVPVILLVAMAGALVASLFPIPLPLSGHAGSSTPSPVPADQLAVMQSISRTSGVPWELLAAVASVESDFGAN